MKYEQLSNEFDSQRLLDILKQRLRIFHAEEDDMLKDMLDGSVQLIAQFTGVNDLNNATFRNLVLTRAMYVFNDQTEYFFENYRTEINDLAISVGGDELVEQASENA